MLEVCTLASGSSGNCLLVRGGGSQVLVDAGISCRRIVTALRELGVDPRALVMICEASEVFGEGFRAPEVGEKTG